MDHRLKVKVVGYSSVYYLIVELFQLERFLARNPDEDGESLRAVVRSNIDWMLKNEPSLLAWVYDKLGSLNSHT